MALSNLSIEVLNALGIIFASLLLACLLYIVLNRHVSKVTKSTKTTLDDEILSVMEKFAPIGVILVGLYFGLVSLSLFAQYSSPLRSIFTIIIVLLSAYVVVKIVNLIIKWYGEHVALKNKTELCEQFLPILRRVINFFIYLIALIIIVNKLNLEVSPFIATLGVGGIAVALALQESLTNFFAGFYLSIDRPLKIGEFVKLETGEEGYIEEIGWRSAKMRLLANNIIVIPNSRLSQSVILNYSRPTKDMGLVIPVGVSYNSDLEKVERVTIEIAKDVLASTVGAVKDFQPFIRYNEFGDFNIKFSVILQVQTAVDKYLVTHEFIKALKKRYDEEGIEISYTIRKLYTKNM
jgi:small-conductance mechanosensitive channel